MPRDVSPREASCNTTIRVLQVSTNRSSIIGDPEREAQLSTTGKTFGYVTPPLQPTAKDLPLRFLRASAFHFLASPDQLTLQVKDLLEARKEAGIITRPLIVWEPAPMHCRPNSLAAHVEASKLVDVFSPNHQELDALCGRLKQQGPLPPADVGREHVEGKL